MPTLSQCFSALIASGNGQKCNLFRERIRKQFLEVDFGTGKLKSELFKYGMNTYPEVHKILRTEMGELVSSIKVDKKFFGPDLEK